MFLFITLWLPLIPALLISFTTTNQTLEDVKGKDEVEMTFEDLQLESGEKACIAVSFARIASFVPHFDDEGMLL